MPIVLTNHRWINKSESNKNDDDNDADDVDEDRKECEPVMNYDRHKSIYKYIHMYMHMFKYILSWLIGYIWLTNKCRMKTTMRRIRMQVELAVGGRVEERSAARQLCD